MTGNPICNIEYHGVKGGALLELLKRCGIAAECLGNHEFDLGAEHLRAMSRSRLIRSLRPTSAKKRTAAQSRGDAHLRRGRTARGRDRSASRRPGERRGALCGRTVPRRRRRHDRAARIDKLAVQTDVIVLLTHMGVEEDSVLATKMKGADVIVGGHSHTRLAAEAA